MSTIELTPDMVGTPDMRSIYALRVKGNTGAQMSIADDDIVIVKHTDQLVEDGGMYVIRWNASEETAIRYVYDLGLTYELHTHSRCPERIVRRDEVEIQGQVLSVIRHLEDKPCQPS